MEAFDMELIKRQIDKYIKADRKTKKKMINEYIRLTGIKRKTAIKRFNRFIKPDRFKTKRIYIKRGRPAHWIIIFVIENIIVRYLSSIN